jgi:predicted dinucleotide-utilizing enzyme
VLDGPADQANPKTSSITAFSILHTIGNLDRAMVI